MAQLHPSQLVFFLTGKSQVAKTLAYSNKLPEGNGVRVLFTDFGAKSLVATRWGELPENLFLDSLTTPGSHGTYQRGGPFPVGIHRSVFFWDPS